MRLTIKVASMQRLVWVPFHILSRDFAENLIELELNNEGDEVSDVAHIGCNMELGSGIKILLGANVWGSNT